MTAMTAARVHNTRPTPIVVAGVTIPAGRSAELDVDLEQLPAGAYVNPTKVAQPDPTDLAALEAGAPVHGYTVTEAVTVIDRTTDGLLLARIRDEELAATKPRKGIVTAAEARLAELANTAPPAPTDDEPQAVELEEPTP